MGSGGKHLARTREPGGLTEKGAEILKYIMLKQPRIIAPLRREEPGTVPRSRPHWSSRTIWDQGTRRKFITRVGGRWRVTERGLWALASSQSQTADLEETLRIAEERFPEGRAVKLIRGRLRMMENLHKDAVESLKIPNVFVACRTNKQGRVDWLVVNHDVTRKEFRRYSRFFLRV